MKAEEILKSDVLDILFEDRNKNYGAYELRRNYAGRLQKALAICASLLLVVLTTGFVMAKNSKVEKPVDYVTDVQLVDQVKEKPPVIEQPKPQVVEQQTASIKNTIPLIVKDNIFTEVPPQEEMEGKTIALVTRDGVEEETVHPPINEGPIGNSEETIKPKKEVYEEKFWRVELMPTYPGGMEALIKFLQRNLKSPSELEQPVQVVIQFVVAKDGSITELVINKSGGNEFDKEVQRVIKMMPNWVPGEQNGHPVAVYFNLPVTFTPEAE
jgi:periplasmic protein TonB